MAVVSSSGPTSKVPSSPVAYPLCEVFHVDTTDIHARRAFLSFAPVDEENLNQIHAVIHHDLKIIIDEFYTHVLQFEGLQRFFADAKLQERLRQTLSEYLLSLGRNADRLDYFEDRLRIGMIHEQVGLEQKWYLGAYVKLFDLIGQRVTIQSDGNAGTVRSVLATLQKIFTLDLTLAVETYYQTTMQRLKATLEQLTEAKKALEDLARIDPLTQISNRLFVREALDKELQRSLRFHRPFSLLFIDVDHFKLVNDRFGHPAGDFALKEVVRLIRDVLRPSDIIGRCGGEEFLVGLVETDASAARVIAERLRLTVAQTPISLPDTELRLTISAGLVALGSGIEDLATMIQQADCALYHAKATGRNRISESA